MTSSVFSVVRKQNRKTQRSTCVLLLNFKFMKKLLLTLTILSQFLFLQAQELQSERDTLKKPLVKSTVASTKSASTGGGGSSTGLAPVSMPIMPSPTAASLVRNATASPNLYTGAVNVSIPLYTLPAQGMSIPIGLVYQSNGVKVNEKNGPLGMTWALQGGGAVARIVRGYPDEFQGKMKKETWINYSEKLKEEVDVTGYWYNKIQTDYDTNKESFNEILNNTEGKDKKIWDTEPDKYLFSAPGLAGSFYIPQKNANPIIHCDADIDIQVHFENNQLMGFVITTASGLCYEFGMNKNYLEKQVFSTESTISEARNYKEEDLVYKTKTEIQKVIHSDTWMNKEDAYTATWYLKRIITPYHADNVNYKYAIDNDRLFIQAKSIDLILDNAYDHFEFTDENQKIKINRIPLNDKYLSQNYVAKQTRIKFIAPKRLVEISSSCGKVELTYTDNSGDDKRINKLFFYGADKKTLIKNYLVNYQYSESKISEPSYPQGLLKTIYRRLTLPSKGLSIENSETKRYFLKEIKEINRTGTDSLHLFSFEYHKPDLLPKICSQLQNHNGFYIGYPSFSSHFKVGEANYYDLLAYKNSVGGRRSNSSRNNNETTILDTTVSNGILIAMQNATGARTEFIYDATPEGAILKHAITTDGTKKINTIDYLYNKPTAPYGNTSNIYPVGEYQFGISPWGHTETILTQGSSFGYQEVIVSNNSQKSRLFFTSAYEYDNTLLNSTYFKKTFKHIEFEYRHSHRSSYKKDFTNMQAFIDAMNDSYSNEMKNIEKIWKDIEKIAPKPCTLEYLKYVAHMFNQKNQIKCEIIYEDHLITEKVNHVGRPTERDQLRGRILRKESYNLKGKLSGIEEYDYSTIFLNKYEAKLQPFIVSESYTEASEDKYIVPYSIDYETLRLNGVKSTSYMIENEPQSSESSIEKYSQINPFLAEVSVQKNLTTNDIVRTEIEYLVFSGSNTKSSKKPLQKGKVDINDDDQGGNGGTYTNNSPKYNPYPKYTTKKQVIYKNDQQLSGSEVIYNQSTRLPKQVKTWINGKYETSITYDKYDYKSRLLQAHGRDDIPTSYRYNGNFLELTVQNATYQEISNGKAEDLRKNLPKAIIASAKYSPEGLLLNQTDANGYSVFYEYDDFGRLKLLRDHDQNIVKAYDYQYGKVGQETISSEKLGIGQMVVGESFVVGGYTNTKTQGLPSAGKNFIASYGFKRENASFYDRTNPKTATTNIEYQDGLGRAIQQVAVNVLPQEYSLVQAFEYDSLGRQSIQYRSLPILSDSKYKKNWEQFLKNKYETSYKAETTYDEFNRISKQGSFGENYAVNKHASTNQYGMNQDSIPSYKADLNSEDYQKKDYPKGTLYKTAVYFEGITNVSYKNMNGQVVRKAAVRGMQTSDPDYGSALITDYVYDDYGNLRAILPPQAKGDIGANNYVYKFLYDERNRLVKKEIPGAGNITLAYDELDRLIHETDAKGTTSYIKYDELSRPIETGYFSPQDPPLTPPEGGGSATSGKEIVLSKSYYDNYEFDFANNNPCSSEHAENNLGRITGSEIRILGSDTFIKAVSYYDKEGRVIEAISQNNTGGIDKVTTAFDFQGNVTETKVSKTFNGKEFSTKQQYEYGTTGELLYVHHSVNGQSSIVLSSFEYNSDGSLAGKKVHNGKIETQYTYDELNRMIKSQSEKYLTLELAYDTKLKGANNTEYYDGSLSAMAWETKSQKRHTYRFGYDGWKNLIEANSDDHPYTAKYKYDENGNMSFLSRNDSLDLFQEFKYDYKNTNQLRELWRKNTEIVEVWPGDANNDGKVEVDDQHPVGYNYKLKIRARDTRSTEWKAFLIVQRKGDDLAFSDTNGDGLINEADTIAIHQNLLKKHKLTDALPTDAFSYEYDKNGNMVYDQYKKIRISYNILNLPDTITAEGQGKIVNQYLADGTLLRRSIFDTDDNEQQRIDYQGEFLFIGDELDKVFTEEGYYKPTEATKTKKSDLGTYYYTLADHLGHTRLVIDEDENVLQETAYYPYGTPIAALSSETKYNYLYTGKEFLDNFGLNWYDHHARYFDPEVGRWWATDPQLVSASPYMAMRNNPMTFTDQDGENPFVAAIIIGAVIGAGSYTYGTLKNEGISGWNWGQFISSTMSGAIMSGMSAGITSGIGGAFSGVSNGFVKTAGSAAVHGIAQGGLSTMQGDNFGTGFASGALGSLGASAGNLNMGRIGYGITGAAGGAFGAWATGGNVINGGIKGGIVGLWNHGEHDQEGTNMLAEVNVIGNRAISSLVGGLGGFNFNHLSATDIYDTPNQDFSGFWGGAKYFWTGGHINGFSYNRNGQFSGLAPRMGTPPLPNIGKIRSIKNILNISKVLRKQVLKGQAPRLVRRVDIPKQTLGKPIHGQVPHIHLSDGRALNLNGTWKHGSGEVPNSIIKWINSIK